MSQGRPLGSGKPTLRRHRFVRGAKPRAKTIARQQLQRDVAAEGPLEAPDVERPKTRADCKDGLRPCPWVGCRFHLYLDVTEAGSLKIVFPQLKPWEMEETCALDVAEQGGLPLEEVGELMNLTRERVRHLQNIALVKLRGTGELDALCTAVTGRAPGSAKGSSPDGDD